MPENATAIPERSQIATADQWDLAKLFPAGSFVGDPYILMNYKEDVLRDVFTLAHEGGHSMHSWNSVRHNPIQHYSYSIFEAEVASTFNEQLLFHYLMERADSREMKAYLVGKQADDIIATIYRQTMFAEFEHLTHRMAEQGEPLTVDSLRATYRQLLERYFGAEMVLEEVSDLEGLRIPHFYNAFYVYKLRHRLGGRGSAGRTRAGQRRRRTRPLHGVSALRRLALPAGVAATRRRRHEHPGAGRAGAARVRHPGAAARTARVGIVAGGAAPAHPRSVGQRT